MQLSVKTKTMFIMSCVSGETVSTDLILERALRATLIVPKGSLDFLATMSVSKSSRKIIHFVTGCITVSKPVLSHQACNAITLATCTCE